jgi:hypothetical protein
MFVQAQEESISSRMARNVAISSLMCTLTVWSSMKLKKGVETSRVLLKFIVLQVVPAVCLHHFDG